MRCEGFVIYGVSPTDTVEFSRPYTWWQVIIIKLLKEIK